MSLSLRKKAKKKKKKKSKKQTNKQTNKPPTTKHTKTATTYSSPVYITDGDAIRQLL